MTAVAHVPLRPVAYLVVAVGVAPQLPEFGSTISSGTSASQAQPKKQTAKLLTPSILLPWKHEKHDCFLLPAFFKPLLQESPGTDAGA